MSKIYVRQVSHTCLEVDELRARDEIGDFSKRIDDKDTSLSDVKTNTRGTKQPIRDESTNVDTDEDEYLQSISKCCNLILSKNGLDQSWSKLRDFQTYEKRDDVDILTYISTFDEKYSEMVGKGMVLPTEVLAFDLLKRANLCKKQMLLALSRIDYSKRENLYDQARYALKVTHGHKGDEKSDSNVENEVKTSTLDRHYMILDSACSGTVCGKKWLDRYLEHLDEESREEVEYNPGKKTFVFGGGEPLKSIASCRIPALVAGRRVTIVTDVVHSEIPLIYSLTDMKKSQVKLDFTNDTAEIYGKVVKLDMTPTGHYCVPIDSIGTTNSIVKDLHKISKDARSS